MARRKHHYRGLGKAGPSTSAKSIRTKCQRYVRSHPGASVDRCIETIRGSRCKQVISAEQGRVGKAMETKKRMVTHAEKRGEQLVNRAKRISDSKRRDACAR
jgi:hypothetical protein